MVSTPLSPTGTFVTQDPYDRPSLLMHLKYTCLWRIWASMLFFTSISVMLVLLDKLQTNVNLGIAPTMLTVLGTVLGFCISYRTSSAYERFIEGRKLWQQVHVATRLASRLIWFHCPTQCSLELEDEDKDADAAKALLEKKTMLNLLEAFAVSLKHYLRGESGIHYEDLYHLILFLPKYQLPNTTTVQRRDLNNPDASYARSTTNGLDEITEDSKAKSPDTTSSSSHQHQQLPHVHYRKNARKDTDASHGSSDAQPGPRNPDKPLLPGHNPPPFNFIDDCLPILAPFRSLFKFGRKTALRILEHNEEALRKQAQKKKKRKHKKDVYTGSCVPQELVFHFSAYIALLNRRKTIDSPLVTALLNANAMLSDAMSGLERVLTTPIPFSYAIHLKHTAYLYLLFLPFQILPTLGYLSIPAVAVASFVYCGFLEIGDQIEQPLGYDSCDLDMGMFAMNIAKELRELSSMPAGDPGEFFFSSLNEPLAPFDTRTAFELIDEKVPLKEIEDSLKKGRIGGNGGNNGLGGGLSRSFTQLHRGSSIGGDKEERPPHTAFELGSVAGKFRKSKSQDALV